jgi:hypothetical protein
MGRKGLCFPGNRFCFRMMILQFLLIIRREMQRLPIFVDVTGCSMSVSYEHFGSCLHFNSNAVISVSGGNQCRMKIRRTVLTWDERARRQQIQNVFPRLAISMEQRVFMKNLREEGHGSTQIHSKLVGHYWDKPLSYPDVRDCVR